MHGQHAYKPHTPIDMDTGFTYLPTKVAGEMACDSRPRATSAGEARTTTDDDLHREGAWDNIRHADCGFAVTAVMSLTRLGYTRRKPTDIYTDSRRVTNAPKTINGPPLSLRIVGHPTIGKPNNPAIHKVRVPGLEMSRATSTSADNQVVTWSAPITTKRSRMALVKVTSSLKNMRFARMSILTSIGNCQQEFVRTKLHACKGAYVVLESIPLGKQGC
jgi:hypothetical protein